MDKINTRLNSCSTCEHFEIIIDGGEAIKHCDLFEDCNPECEHHEYKIPDNY